MPLYEFRCTCGHVFEKLCRSSDDDSPACPKCGGVSEKVFSSFSVGRSAPATGCRVQGGQAGGPCSSCSYARHVH
ncbi:MAG: zinc ribbon domain-containing protein [Bacillota bacterium]